MRSALERYLASSSIHGFQYLTRRNGCLARTIFALAILGSVVICGLIIANNVSESEERQDQYLEFAAY